MTTLLDDGHALVVRCDECRRLWPVTRERFESVWRHDAAGDRDRCPVCAGREAGAAAPASSDP